MEFNDVIIFNFFDPALDDKWKILKYTDLYPPRGERKFRIEEIDDLNKY